MDNLKNIIREEFKKNFLICEVKININDINKQGYATQIGQMYVDALKSYKPKDVSGFIGMSGDEYRNLLREKNINLDLDSESVVGGDFFTINLENGDVIEAIRNTYPSVAYVYLNGEMIAEINNPNELFKNNLPKLVKKYYSEKVLVKKDAELQ